MKKEYQDDFEKFIKEGFDRQAKKELDAVKNDESLEELPESLKISMRQKIDARIKETEAAKAVQEKVDSEKSEGSKTAYDNLSEEDRKALELGRKMLEEGKVTEFREPEKKGLSSRGKLRLKHALGLVAVLAVVMLVEVNSLGGPEKIVKMVKQQVAEREVEKINSGSENKIIVKENEEEAYQTIADEFGVDPIRILERPSGMKFKELELDKNMLIAWITYEYKGEKIRYVISAVHKESSVGFDIEDELIDETVITIGNIKIQIEEYKRPETEIKYYVARYMHNNLKYSLIGNMDYQDFEEIIKNLYIY